MRISVRGSRRLSGPKLIEVGAQRRWYGSRKDRGQLQDETGFDGGDPVPATKRIPQNSPHGMPSLAQ